MTKTVSVSELKASHVDTIKGVWVSRFDGDFIVRSCFKGYEVVTAQTKQRLACYSDIKSVKKFLTNF